MIKSVLTIFLFSLIISNGRAQIPVESSVSSNNYVGSIFADHHFIQLNEHEQIDLPSLYDSVFTQAHGTAQYSSLNSRKANEMVTYSPINHYYPVSIIDSIDLNGDGTKELFVRRRMTSYVTSSHAGPYGEGNQHQTYESYEVWDVKSKQRIFEIKNSQETMVAITTNVIQTFGYQFDVSVDQEGNFHISGTTDGSGYTPGTYVYKAAKGVYERE